MGIAIPVMDTFETWFVSQLGKFVPGKVWLVLGRFYFYQSRGKAKKDISVAIYLEAATLIIAAGILSLAVIFHINGSEFYSWKANLASLIFLFFLALLSLHPRILAAIVNKVLVLLKKNTVSFAIVYADILGILLICLASWALAGLAFYLLVDSIIPIPVERLLFVGGALALSSTLGLLAFFSPSGLGVREGVLTYILSMVMPTSVAILISVLSRFWMTLVEVGLIGAVCVIGKVLRKSKPSRKETTKV